MNVCGRTVQNVRGTDQVELYCEIFWNNETAVIANRKSSIQWIQFWKIFTYYFLFCKWKYCLMIAIFNFAIFPLISTWIHCRTFGPGLLLPIFNNLPPPLPPKVLGSSSKPCSFSAKLHEVHHQSALPPLSLHCGLCLVGDAAVWRTVSIHIDLKTGSRLWIHCVFLFLFLHVIIVEFHSFIYNISLFASQIQFWRRNPSH